MNPGLSSDVAFVADTGLNVKPRRGPREVTVKSLERIYGLEDVSVLSGEGFKK